MLKTTALSISARPAHIRSDKNDFDIDGYHNISGGMIDNKIVNLLSFTKKMSSEAGFLTSKASLAFTQLRKAFTKALILHYFNPKHYIWIKTNCSGYAIGRMLS